MFLDPSPLSQTVTLSRTPSSVAYFMDFMDFMDTMTMRLVRERSFEILYILVKLLK